MQEIWYRLGLLPDLGLNKYASLEGSGVDGVLEKHIAFLRQWNRKGVLTGVSLHLFYLYLCHDDAAFDRPGRRLEIIMLIRGEETAMENVPSMMAASPLADFYHFTCPDEREISGLMAVFDDWQLRPPHFCTCSILTKSETLLSADGGDNGSYYMIREWESNENGRLYTMCKLVEALNRTAVFRVDLYPTEKSHALREALRKPVGILRKRQDERFSGGQRDYAGRDVLSRYEQIMEQFESSPHFIANIMVFADRREDAAAILDAAGAESLMKGKYSVATFTSTTGFKADSFIGEAIEDRESDRDGMVLRAGKTGLIVCRADTVSLNLNYLPTLFSLEEIAPFFRFPALYEGEVIQKPRETAPPPVSGADALYLGTDNNGFPVRFPLKQLAKHAFVSGVPGSGKTNLMLHAVSTLWKRKPYRIPFLVLEPAKQEYRALANDPDMAAMYLFSPNADMSFPLHINPFEMPKGIMVAEHIRRLCSVFEGAFPLDNPMPFLLDTAIEAVYRELGWSPDHVYTGDEKTAAGINRKHLPTLSMLYRRLEDELKSTRYSEEIRGNLESALKVRIGSLLRREMGDVFDVPESTFPPEKWLQVPAVIELESMGTGPANFLTLMLCTLIRESIKASPYCDKEIRHVLFIEEAHNLIGPESDELTGMDANPKQAATAFLVKMLAEVRALKESIIIADQLPTVMAQEVIKNTGLKIGLRITSADDRSLLGSTMAASGVQLEQMATFDTGEALIFYEGLMRPFRIHINEWWGDIKDQAEKAYLTEPRNDAALRELLAERSSYQETVNTSVLITGRKYKRLLDDLTERAKPRIQWADAVARLKNKIIETDALVQAKLLCIEQGIASLSREEEAALYDRQYHLQAEYKAMHNNSQYVRELAELPVQAGEWAFRIEGMMQGRWKRSGASDQSMRHIAELQQWILHVAFELYHHCVPALQDLTKGQELAAYMDQLSELRNRLERNMAWLNR